MYSQRYKNAQRKFQDLHDCPRCHMLTDHYHIKELIIITNADVYTHTHTCHTSKHTIVHILSITFLTVHILWNVRQYIKC